MSQKYTHGVTPHTEAQRGPSTRAQATPRPLITGHKDHRVTCHSAPGSRPLLGRVNHLATRCRVTLPPCETEASQSQQFKI